MDLTSVVHRARGPVTLATFMSFAGGGALADDAAHVWAKSGNSIAAVQADLQACEVATRQIHGQIDQDSINLAYTSTPGSPLGRALGVIIVEAVWQAKADGRARVGATDKCMHSQGYHAVPLTAQEAADFRAQPSAKREAWIEAFYARSDFRERLASVSPAPLPDGIDEPLTLGPVELDPATFAAANSLVGPGGVILTASAVLRPALRLDADVSIGVEGKSWFSAGQLLHKAVFRAEDGAKTTYWCGATQGDPNVSQACIRNDWDEFVVNEATGPAWVTTGLSFSSHANHLAPGDLHVHPAPAVPGQPLRLSVVLTAVNPRYATVDVTVAREGETQTLETGLVHFDDKREAILPLWSRRLVLTYQASGGVEAELRDDGDGSAWDP